jgi:hypothetical protein
VCLMGALRNNSASTGRILTKFDIYAFFFRTSIQKFQVALKSDKNNGNFTRVFTFIITR